MLLKKLKFILQYIVVYCIQNKLLQYLEVIVKYIMFSKPCFEQYKLKELTSPSGMLTTGCIKYPQIQDFNLLLSHH